MSDDSSLDERKRELDTLLARRLQRAERKLHHLKNTAAECQKWRDLYHEAELLQGNFYLWKKGVAELVVEDWEKEGAIRRIALDPLVPLTHEIKKRFQRSKKMKLAQNKLITEQEKASQLIAALQKQLFDLEAIDELPKLLSFVSKLEETQTLPKKKPAKEYRSLPYRQYRTVSGWQILAGKGAAGNETVTFKLANGNDWWLHVDGFSGSHVVLKGPEGHTPRDVEPDQESLHDALLVALTNSKASQQGQANIVVTQVKYVKRLGKGLAQIGKVQISKHKLLKVKFDSQRLQHINERRVTN